MNLKTTFIIFRFFNEKKENPQLGSNSRVIKNYYIKSQDYLLKHYDEIIKLCEIFNARASIRLNKRSFEKVGFKALTNLSNTMMNREYQFLKASYDRACGLGHNDKNKKWILDIDNVKEINSEFLQTINNIEPIGNKVLATIKSKSGLHLITIPFNLHKFTNEYPEIEIHKDNPTNLYIP